MSLEEFALTWNNFTENVVSGFSTLFLHGQLCDVTLAVEGKLLKAHKVVLSICSPYFQRMFAENPCQHPVIVLKDMSAKLVANLLEFMYQGSVNVKQSELKAFMRIAENLQIKGLTTNSKQLKVETNDDNGSSEKVSEAMKRSLDADDNSSESSTRAPKSVKMEAEEDVTDLTNDDECEAQSNEDLLLAVPEISMVESRASEAKQKDDGMRHIPHPHPQTLNLFSPYEYTPEALLAETQTKSGSSSEMNGSNVTMLSSTSLLHGNCIFNRNNTVATQQGLKTYWLCKSYRISMCKARCITHQGKVISATGVHNHVPHMSGSKQELPPGHTPNVVHPPLPQPPMNEFSVVGGGAMPSTSATAHHSQNLGHQQLMMSQPYQYLHQQHNMHPESHAEQQMRSLPNEGKLPFASPDGNGFKIEHPI